MNAAFSMPESRTMTAAHPIVTLTTDFGEESPYVAAMKGVLLAVNPALHIVDLSHQIPAQDVRHAAFFLRAAIPCFPPGTIHVVVVDPGVGSDRALLCVEVFGQKLLVPDNGCWTLLAGLADAPAVTRLTEARYWRHPIAPTFHGRDILAPVAGHLSLGVAPSTLGPALATWEKVSLPVPHLAADGVAGEVVFVDRFGNLITNIAAEHFADPEPRVTIDSALQPRWVRTYACAPPGTLVALPSSFGLLEIALVQGSAARQLGATIGMPVHVQRAKPRQA